MKYLIIVLLILSFIQTTVIPLDLVLIVLICRSYLKTDRNNLLLAFGFGLFLSHLNITPMGFQSIIYLIIVILSQGLAKSRLAGNALLIIPLTFVLVALNKTLLSLMLGQSLNVISQSVYEAILSLPIFYIVRLWEERFIVKRDIRLKL